MKNSQLALIIVAVLIVIAGGYFAWSKNLIPFFGKQPASLSEKQDTVMSQNNQFESNTQDTTPDAALGADGMLDTDLESTEEFDSPEGKRSDEKADEGLRQEIIAYVNKNLSSLAKPVANSAWDLPTFYFVGNSNVYVFLYDEEGDTLGIKLLYKATKADNGMIELSEVARFKETEEDWALISGQDNFDDYVMEEYDYNEDTKKWEKTDEFTEEYYLDESSESDEESEMGQIVR